MNEAVAARGCLTVNTRTPSRKCQHAQSRTITPFLRLNIVCSPHLRRHSEPIPTTAVAALSPSAYAQGSSEGSPFLQSQGSPFLQSRALGPEGSSAVQALANTNKTNKRRAESTGGVGIVTREGTGAAFETFEAINSSFPAGSGANSMIATGLLVEGGGKESEMDRFLEEEEPSFQPEVDIVDIARMGMGVRKGRTLNVHVICFVFVLFPCSAV